MDRLRPGGRETEVPQIPALAWRPDYVIYGPLAQAPLAPDVVLPFVHASQTPILSEAAQQLEGLSAPGPGPPRVCRGPAGCEFRPNRLSLGCCGAGLTRM